MGLSLGTAIWYVFNTMNSWMRLPVFTPTHSAVLEPVVLNISVERIAHSSAASSSSVLVNSAEEYLRRRGAVRFTVCHYLPPSFPEAKLRYEWTISTRNQIEPLATVTGANCSQTWQAPGDGFYRVHLKAYHNDHLLAEGTGEAHVVDYWFVAVGDSYASGEGNPDEPVGNGHPAKWLLEPCHRSTRSWPYKVYEQLSLMSRNSVVHFTFLACTGASVDSGLLSSASGSSQLDIVEQIAKARGSGPDLLLMTIGGNDVGYSEILSGFFSGETQSLFSTLDMRFFYVYHQLDRLGQRLRSAIRPKQVVLPLYFDITRNEDGEVDASCKDFKQVSTDVLKVAERRILRRLNKVLSDKGRKFAWTVVDDANRIFRFSGVCSRRSLIRY
ncbi:Protein Y39B6A.7 [Aphelenchoides avenae]|nr:Protein Y39B6A.7 [Aphelenchus avenae]